MSMEMLLNMNGKECSCGKLHSFQTQIEAVAHLCQLNIAEDGGNALGHDGSQCHTGYTHMKKHYEN